MTAFSILAGIGLLTLVLALHLLLWRFGAVRREMLWLFVLFFGVPLAPLAWLYGSRLASGVESLAIALFWFALASAYVQTYPVLRHVIPTFRILLLLRRTGPQGLTDAEIIRALADEGLFAGGLNDLEHDSLVKKTGDRYSVTRAGAILAGAFYLYRKALGVQHGRG